MGVKPTTSVVDPRGRVWGTDGLYVADAVRSDFRVREPGLINYIAVGLPQLIWCEPNGDCEHLLFAHVLIRCSPDSFPPGARDSAFDRPVHR